MLEQAISQLKEEHRKVILLRSIHGFSSKECAEILDCKGHQVDSMLSYARKRLREILGALDDGRLQQGGRS
jgi:RNA polymerase sigma-70 factor (ECF subfamily)